MTWSSFVDAVAERAGLPRAQVRRVLVAFVATATDTLARGEDVQVPGLGTFGSRWEGERTLRSIRDGRKLALDAHFRPVFRPAAALRDAMRTRTPQVMRDPAHQQAWRLAETLVGDLALYHGRLAPAGLPDDAAPSLVHARCASSFGDAWTRVCASWEAQTPESVRAARDHLAYAARRRWAVST